MKIIITENQYRKLLSENNEDGIDEFKQLVKRGRFIKPDHFFEYYFSAFDYNDNDSLSAIGVDDELYNIFLGKILSGYFKNSLLWQSKSMNFELKNHLDYIKNFFKYSR